MDGWLVCVGLFFGRLMVPRSWQVRLLREGLITGRARYGL